VNAALTGRRERQKLLIATGGGVAEGLNAGKSRRQRLTTGEGHSRSRARRRQADLRKLKERAYLIGNCPKRTYRFIDTPSEGKKKDQSLEELSE